MIIGGDNAIRQKLIILLSASGVILALLATWQTIQITGGAVIPLCRVSSWLNCATAHGSSFAWLFGLPVGWLGFLYYFWLVLMASRRPEPEECPGAWHSALLLSVISLLFTLIAAIYSAIQLQSFCPICILMYVINFLLFFQFFPFKPGLLNEFRTLLDDLRKNDEIRINKHSSPVVLLSFLLFFIIGAVGFKMIIPTPQQRIDLLKEVVRFYEQPLHSYQIAERPILGDPSATIQILIISDFACPYCAMAGRNLERLVFRHPGQVSLVFIHYPLDKKVNPYIPESIHKSSGMLARAAECAHQLGHFWSFHDSLFAQRGEIDDKKIQLLAASQKISLPEFESCLAAAKSGNAVARDIELAHRLKISGTPSVFLNGRQLELWFFTPLVEEIILREQNLINQNKTFTEGGRL